MAQRLVAHLRFQDAPFLVEERCRDVVAHREPRGRTADSASYNARKGAVIFQLAEARSAAASADAAWYADSAAATLVRCASVSTSRRFSAASSSRKRSIVDAVSATPASSAAFRASRSPNEASFHRHTPARS